MSVAPVVLGRRDWICAAISGKISAILCLFHLKSVVRRSETRKSNTAYVQGPIGFTLSDSEIHESCQTFVVCPFPMTFPRFDFKSSRPCSILRHPWEHTEGTDTSRKLLLWQYFPNRIRESRQLGTVRILHATLARRAWLNS